MNNSPIGFFDSGIGGLSVYARFRELLPNENTIYYGDLKNLPYGNKSKEELIGFARNILNFFKTKEAYLDVIVILKDGRIIDVCPLERGATLSMLTNKREIAGKLFLQHSEGIIIEVNGALFEYPTLLGFKFLNKKGVNIALFVGSYKKNLELAAVAVGREE